MKIRFTQIKYKKYFPFFLPALIFLVIYIAGYFISKTELFSPKEESAQPTISRDKAFDANIGIFNQSFKDVLLATREGDKAKSEQYFNDLAIKWKELLKFYATERPADYMRTKDWEAKLQAINELIEKTGNAIKDGRLAEAHNNLLTIAELIKKLHDENNKRVLNDDLIMFYRAAEIISAAADKAEVMQTIQDLKYYFTILKDYNLGAQYKAEMEEIEKTIGDLDRLDGSDFLTAKQRLEPEFNKLYEQIK